MNIAIAVGVPFLTRASKVISDAFNRADNPNALGNADTGQTWQALVGTWGIISNQAYLSTGVASSLNMAVIPAVSDLNGEVYFTFGSDEGGFAFRVADTNNFLIAYVRSNGLILYKKVAGAASQIGSYAFTALTGTSYKISVSAVGSSINVKLNDVLRISANEPNLRTNTKCGMYNYMSSTTTTSRLDNFKVVSA